MKRNILCAAVIILSLTFQASPLKALANPGDSSLVLPDSARLSNQLFRLNQLQGMEKSSLTAAEKKDLRKELKELKKQQSRNGGGIYLSVGAAIIIVLLLILLL